jgi:hypothetical protein
LAQIGGFDSTALATNSFWAHVGKATPNEWRITEGRVAWVVTQNAAAIGNNSFWALMGQNLTTPQFCWIVKRLVETVASKHGNASLGMECYWARLGEHMPNAQWDVGFTAFLAKSHSAGTWEYFWARFRSPYWTAAISSMRTRMVDVIRACKSPNKPVGISRAVLEAHAEANPTQIALSPATAGLSIPRCECADIPCSCNGPWLVE